MDDKRIRDLALALRDRWASEGLPVLPGVSEAEIAYFEEQMFLRLPEDIRTFYSEVNGIDGLQCGGDLIHFWPLWEVMEEYHQVEKHPPSGVLYFADWSIHAEVFGVQIPTSGARSGAVTREASDHATLADSFGEFLGLYLQDSDRCHMTREERTEHSKKFSLTESGWERRPTADQ
ncbi:MAG TPA: SMI1/KNR4 family protein [Thermoplasmata archaeon]|nr:SMI1/KNR4 family protein [Thermoplasmata archaeon]